MQCQSDEQFSDEYEERISQSDGLSISVTGSVTQIDTPRLTLRKPHCDDIDAISTLANDIAVASMLSRMPYPYKRADAEDFVNTIAKLENGNCVYAITLNETGEFIGCCGIEKKPGRERMEIGYWLGKPYWGNGYATEAAHALVDKAFRICNIEEIIGRCRIGNMASRNVLQKSGFQFIGTGMNLSLAQDTQVPVELYRLERKIWDSLRNWPESTEQKTKLKGG